MSDQARSFGIRAEVTALLESAAREHGFDETGEQLRWVVLGLNDPLRVAIAGRVKAGKSTLVNALIGERIAPTDETECTQIVTWYREGGSVVTARLDGGEYRQLPYRRSADGALEVQLGDLRPADVNHLVVDWRSPTLRRLWLIDTPGIGSLTAEHEERTSQFIVAGRADLDTADAVIYLTNHLHHEDRRFLEAFHDDELAHPSPVNTIAVLSRADELGSGRMDAMEVAQDVAWELRANPQIRHLAQTVVPVSGLLAQTAATLRQADFDDLTRLARTHADDRLFLVSADRFLGTPDDVVSTQRRRRLFELLGMYGLRLAMAWISSGDIANASHLASALRSISGLDLLEQELDQRFGERAGVLKSRWALARAHAVLQSAPASEGRDRIGREIERIQSTSHEFAEIRLLDQLRTADLGLRPDELVLAERLIGGDGSSIEARLGLPGETSMAEAREAALEALHRWRRRAEHPQTTRAGAQAASTLAETCEILYQRADATEQPTP
jgi:GTP-binding protein EngB required for normal cell division